MKSLIYLLFCSLFVFESLFAQVGNDKNDKLIELIKANASDDNYNSANIAALVRFLENVTDDQKTELSPVLSSVVNKIEIDNINDNDVNACVALLDVGATVDDDDTKTKLNSVANNNTQLKTALSNKGLLVDIPDNSNITEEECMCYKDIDNLSIINIFVNKYNIVIKNKKNKIINITKASSISKGIYHNITDYLANIRDITEGQVNSDFKIIIQEMASQDKCSIKITSNNNEIFKYLGLKDNLEFSSTVNSILDDLNNNIVKLYPIYEYKALVHVIRSYYYGIFDKSNGVKSNYPKKGELESFMVSARSSFSLPLFDFIPITDLDPDFNKKRYFYINDLGYLVDTLSLSFINHIKEHDGNETSYQIYTGWINSLIKYFVSNDKIIIKNRLIVDNECCDDLFCDLSDDDNLENIKVDSAGSKTVFWYEMKINYKDKDFGSFRYNIHTKEKEVIKHAINIKASCSMKTYLDTSHAFEKN